MPDRPPAPHGDRWLNRAEQAEHLGVDIPTIAYYASQRFGPSSTNPYPTHIDGQWRPGVTTRTAPEVLESALKAWDARRTRHRATRPEGLTAAQWNALGALAAGEEIAYRHLLVLASKGYAHLPAEATAPQVTVAGRRLIDQHKPQE